MNTLRIMLFFVLPCHFRLAHGKRVQPSWVSHELSAPCHMCATWNIRCWIKTLSRKTTGQSSSIAWLGIVVRRLKAFWHMNVSTLEGVFFMSRRWAQAWRRQQVHLYIMPSRVIPRCIIGGIICVLTIKSSHSKRYGTHDSLTTMN